MRPSRFRVLASLSLLAAAFLHSPSARAFQHRVEIDGALGYRFGGALDVEVDEEQGRLTLDGAPAFTAIVSYRVQGNGFVFLNYSRQNTTIRYRSNDLMTTGEAAFTTDYLQFGGNLEATMGRLTPYFGVSIGTTRLASGNLGDEWRFSIVADGGAKLQLTNWLHLRALGRMPVTILEGSSTVLCVSGGCVARLSGTPLVQGEFYLGFGFQF